MGEVISRRSIASVGPVSILAQSVWALWWTNWHCDGFLSKYLCFPLSFPFHRRPRRIHSSATDAIWTYQLIFFLIFCWPCISIYLFININQLDALNFIRSLFQASACFEHMCSSSGGQKLYHTVSGIITPIGGCPVHRLREDTLSICAPDGHLQSVTIPETV